MELNELLCNDNQYTSIQFDILNNQRKNNDDENLNFLTKKKKKSPKEKQQNLKKRKDYLYKQIKIHVIKFAIQTLNNLLKEIIKLNEFNSFYLFQNKFKNELKDNLKKEFNIQLIDLTLKDILIKYSQNKNNEKVLNKIEQLNNTENCKLINKFLNIKFIDLIDIYVMSNDKFKENFYYENNLLLINDSSIVNKKEIFDLINFGIRAYLYNKRDLQQKK